MMRRLAVAVAVLFAGPAAAVECKDQTVAGNRYTLCAVDAAREDLRLFLADSSGRPYGHFAVINAALAEKGLRLAFAMNAGMYHDDRSPVGHYVENGKERMRVIPNAGPGNFGMLPNGVFCIRKGRADVFETKRYLAENPGCDFATQSGPMLVIDGALHPRFLPESTSRRVRNGVGTSDDGRAVVFVISRDAVTFHEFGSLFRDTLGLRNALYFDGNISRLYAPSIGRDDAGFAMGPVVGVVEPAD